MDRKEKQKEKPELSEEVQEIIRSYDRNAGTSYTLLRKGFQATAIVLLVAVSSSLAQLTLSPVYGSVPASRYYLLGSRLAMLAGWGSRKRMPKLLPPSARNYLPAIAALIPIEQFFLFKQSEILGPVVGPILTNLITYWLLAFVGSSAVAQFMEIDGLCPGTLGFVASYFTYHNLSNLAEGVLGDYIGACLAMTRVPLQLLVAAAFSVTFPSRWLWVAIPAMLLTATFDIHAPFELTTERLNHNLARQGYTLLERRESTTGYLSVLESNEKHFRVLRCDHSLLGGEWTNYENERYPDIKEPVFVVFAMLEAVRLVEPEDEYWKPDEEKNSLVIGLGIGTTPAALATHGIDTTVVEIDPGVVDLAKKHFHLPEKNLNIVVGDAADFVDNALRPGETTQYDYIVHDVFTGGVEPAALFTREFMQQLHVLLREDGVIVINYAGDLRLPPAGLVVRTVLDVFPTCRIFREGESSGAPDSDLTNLMIFCKRTISPIEFREANEDDYLGSLSRKSYLQPELEINPGLFATADILMEVLTEEDAQALTMWHPQSAANHWKIMRSVLPAGVWESW
ncbi:hypothetical protein KEM56_000261 [Ascosphaera pollenicola]|nr:hypothetical protein KEM56_000261 [Ascosphaera pollenicola]